MEIASTNASKFVGFMSLRHSIGSQWSHLVSISHSRYCKQSRWHFYKYYFLWQREKERISFKSVSKIWSYLIGAGHPITIPHPPRHSPHVSHHSAHAWDGASDLGNQHRHCLVWLSRLSFSMFTPSSAHPWIYFPGRLGQYRFFLFCIIQKCTQNSNLRSIWGVHAPQPERLRP